MAHGDYTGQRKSDLAQKFHKEQTLRAKELSLVTATVAAENQETIDLTVQDPDAKKTQVNPETGDIEVVEVNLEDPQFQSVTFRSRETVDGVTVGRDNNYNLEEGRTYRAPRWVVEHLDRQGLVYH